VSAWLNWQAAVWALLPPALVLRKRWAATVGQWQAQSGSKWRVRIALPLRPQPQQKSRLAQVQACWVSKANAAQKRWGFHQN
jgi:hypothetical protein